jgi:hypothetical protein
MPAIRAWADHNFPDGKQKMHGEHTPSGQKTQEKGRQIELNFRSGFMRLGNPEHSFKTHHPADLAFTGTIRSAKCRNSMSVQPGFETREIAVGLGRSVAKVYTQFVISFKDFIFGKKLLLLAEMAYRVHRKR